MNTAFIGVSTPPRSTKDRQGECGELDAKVILREILNPLSDCSPVWVPDAEVEGARDLARARQDAVKAAKSAKQKVASLPMRRHRIWNEKTPTGKLKKPWRSDYLAWLDKIVLPDPSAQAALEHYKRAVRRAEEELAEVGKPPRAEAAKPRWRPYVDALVEGISSISRQTAHRKHLLPGHAVSPRVEDIALEANARLKKKHDALKDAGKHASTAKVAVVSELARWMWAMGLRVQRERAAA